MNRTEESLRKDSSGTETFDESREKRPCQLSNADHLPSDNETQDEREPLGIKNPPTRRNQREFNRSMSQDHKRRHVRAFRRDKSRRVIQKFSPEKHVPSKSAMFSAYQCTYCDNIAPQNNPKNVEQHIKSKHPDKKIPSAKEMANAAQRLQNQLLTESCDETAKQEDLNESNSDKSISFVAIPERELIQKKPQISGPWIDMVTQNSIYVQTPTDIKARDVLEIFWKQDLKWYRGKVTKVMRNGSVQFHYNDGEKDSLILADEKFRKINLGNMDPLLRFDNQIGFERLMLKFGKRKKALRMNLGQKRWRNVSKVECERLAANEWLSDRVIDDFLTGLHYHSKHNIDMRFGKLHSHLLTYSGDPELRKTLTGFFDGLEVHEVDVFLLPVHQVNHWLLCHINISERSITIFDPFKPMDMINDESLMKKITTCCECLFAVYDKKYKVSKAWKFESPAFIAKTFNFPFQPSGNSNDCGVFICLYMWSLMTGFLLPVVEHNNVHQFISSTRNSIAALLCTWTSKLSTKSGEGNVMPQFSHELLM